ncbi:MAG: PleD family two-component system response regulator [Acidobacteriota bacterium]
MAKKILIADDSVTIQKVVELAFPAPEYEVSCAGDGARAAKAIASDAPDIALLDVFMPEKNGYDLCSSIKENPDTAWMPVVLLAGSFEEFDEQRAADAGADAHLRKPFGTQTLLAKVQELLAAHPRPGLAPEPTEASRHESSDATGESPPPAARAAGANGEPVDASPDTALEPPEPAPASSPQDAIATTEQGRDASGPSSAPPAAARPGAPAGEKPGEPTRETVTSLCEKVVREIAWEVIPDLAEAIIKKRIEELERECEDQKQA